MACYIVSVETVSAAVLSSIDKQLRTLPGVCPVNKYCWAVIATDKKAIDLVNFLRPSLAPNDRVFVIRSGTEASWLNSYGPKNDEWLKKNL